MGTIFCCLFQTTIPGTQWARFHQSTARKQPDSQSEPRTAVRWPITASGLKTKRFGSDLNQSAAVKFQPVRWIFSYIYLSLHYSRFYHYILEVYSCLCRSRILTWVKKKPKAKKISIILLDFLKIPSLCSIFVPCFRHDMDGLVQDCSVLHKQWRYCSIATSHWYIRQESVLLMWCCSKPCSQWTLVPQDHHPPVEPLRGAVHYNWYKGLQWI